MRFMRSVAFLVAVATPLAARGGGFEIPDNGTEALGRGGAFVAKADDGTALYYNIAGLARQRGTRVTIDSNFLFHGTDFTRSGMYPGTMNDAWAGKPYPTISDSESLFIAPMLGISTDFGWFKRWTFGFGLYGPPSIGKHNYGVADQTKSEVATVKLADGTLAPAPSRYDVSRLNLLIIEPTLGAAFHVNDVFDVGAGLQLIYATFDLANANLTPLGGVCQGGPDVPACDAYGALKTSGIAWGYTLSTLVHPANWMDIGWTYRPQIDVHTTGTLHAESPPGLMAFPDATASFDTQMPAEMRVAVRFASHYLDGTERADVELDGTWENWSAERSDTLRATSSNQPFWKTNSAGVGEVDVVLTHNYIDTLGARLGGAYNFRLTDATRLTARLGGYFDSASTHYQDTRLDFNTAAKWGLTLGAGFKWKGLTINAAYAWIYSPTRDISNSEITAVNSFHGTQYERGDAVLYVGNGTYHYTTQIVSVGLTVNFSEFKRATLFAH
jgi:long-chain fatty acid transport protein